MAVTLNANTSTGFIATSDASGVLQLQTGGTTAITVDASQNVGIGTSSPSGRLHVASSAGNLPLYVTSSASSQNVRIRLNSSDTASSVAYVWSYSDASLNKQASIYLTSAGSLATQINQTAGAEPTSGTLAQTIDSSGNVGIGITPTALGAGRTSVNINGSTDSILWMMSGGTASGYLQAVSTGLNTVGSSNLNVTTTAQGTGIISFITGGTERMRIDSSGNVLVKTAAGLGYGTGSGGTVTQATSKSTAVTLNKPTGQITMNNAALAAGTNVSFSLTNSLIAVTDTLVCSITTAANYSYQIQTYCGAGAAQILLRNIDSVSRSEAIVINFTVIKGATS